MTSLRNSFTSNSLVIDAGNDLPQERGGQTFWFARFTGGHYQNPVSGNNNYKNAIIIL